MSETSLSKKIRILVVDDHILMRIGLISSLNTQPDMEVVAEADDSGEALAAFRACLPDIVVLDMRLPTQTGIELLNQLKKEFGSVRVIMLSSFGTGHEVSAAMDAGACAYVLKSMPLPRLLDTIRRVHAGELVCLPEIARSLARCQASSLTKREMEILTLMAKGMSNKEIASHLNIVEGTVKLHVSSVLSKLGVLDRTQAVLLAVKQGLVDLD